MWRHFHTHIDVLDLQYWHDLIESREIRLSIHRSNRNMPQKEIAEYLQITPNSQSRIRRKLFGK